MSRTLRSTTRLSTRFILYYAIAYLVLIALMGIAVDRAARSALMDEVDDSLLVTARLAAEGLPAEPFDYQDWVGSVFDASGMRTSLISIDGTVVADSHQDPDLMENHLGREEVEMALGGAVGEAQRVSGSTGFDQRYLALLLDSGLIVRTSIPTAVINDQLAAVRGTIVVAGVVLGLIGIVLVTVLAGRLASPISDLTRQALAVAEGNTEIAPHRSDVRELDQLGLAISMLARRVEARVSQAEDTTATLEVVLGALPQGTVLFDEANRVVYANPSARSILGAIPNELSGLAPFQFQEAVREARKSRQPEVRLLDHGTPVRHLRGVATPFTDDDRVLLIVFDVTERERTDSIRRDFVANASHELKTPVSTIIASSEALQIALERGDSSVGGFAARIEASARQLNRLVADLLDLSRLERDQPELGQVRIDHLVREEVERVRKVADANGLEIDLTLEPVVAMASQRDVGTAVRNILDNAVRYTPAGGSVRVSVSQDAHQVFVSVADTGDGIPTRDVERVFERFYRVDSARSRATGGTGLGLSIVKHVAESHGGSVAVESELGMGSTFTIGLPKGEGGESTPDR